MNQLVSYKAITRLPPLVALVLIGLVTLFGLSVGVQPTRAQGGITIEVVVDPSMLIENSRATSTITAPAFDVCSNIVPGASLNGSAWDSAMGGVCGLSGCG